MKCNKTAQMRHTADSPLCELATAKRNSPSIQATDDDNKGDDKCQLAHNRLATVSGQTQPQPKQHSHTISVTRCTQPQTQSSSLPPCTLHCHQPQQHVAASSTSQLSVHTPHNDTNVTPQPNTSRHILYSCRPLLRSLRRRGTRRRWRCRTCCCSCVASAGSRCRPTTHPSCS